MDQQKTENTNGLVQLFVVTEIVGLLAVVLMFYWCFAYNEMFGFSGQPLFNWHPLFMTIGIIYLMGNAFVTFRVFRNTHKKTLKLLHAGINATGLIFTLLGSAAVYVNHNQAGIPNFYSLHSWIGATAVTLYVIQAVVAITTFLFDGASNAVKAFLLPYHVYFGHLIFILGICAAISGINEKLIFTLTATGYAAKPPQALLLNFVGVLMAVYGALVVYMSTNIFYKRHPRPEDSELLNRNTE
jgi:hypothetical protein